MTRLANVTLELYCKNELGKEGYNLMYYIILSIPLPGGTVRYEIPIDEPQYKSLIFAKNELGKEEYNRMYYIILSSSKGEIIAKHKR